MKKIKVTKNDIKFGYPNSATTCPIARAVQRLLPDGNVFVYPTEIEFCQLTESKHDHIRTKLPEEAVQFIRDFDTGNKVRPFTFELEIE